MKSKIILTCIFSFLSLFFSCITSLIIITNIKDQNANYLNNSLTSDSKVTVTYFGTNIMSNKQNTYQFTVYNDNQSVISYDLNLTNLKNTKNINYSLLCTNGLSYEDFLPENDESILTAVELQSNTTVECTITVNTNENYSAMYQIKVRGEK